MQIIRRKHARYFEGDFHITSIIRRRFRLPYPDKGNIAKFVPITFSGGNTQFLCESWRKKELAMASVIYGYMIRAFFPALPLPKKIDAIWSFNKWFQHGLRFHAPQYKPLPKNAKKPRINPRLFFWVMLLPKLPASPGFLTAATVVHRPGIRPVRGFDFHRKHRAEGHAKTSTLPALRSTTLPTPTTTDPHFVKQRNHFFHRATRRDNVFCH